MGIGSATPCDVNATKYDWTPASWANEYGRSGKHRERILAFLSLQFRSPVLRGGWSTPDGGKATDRIDALLRRFRLFSGHWRMEAQRLRCDCNSAYGSGPLDEVQSSRGARCSWACVFMSRCTRGAGLRCHRFPFRSGYRRTAPMRIRVTGGSHRDVQSSSALPQ